jgi:hypothetical protein
MFTSNDPFLLESKDEKTILKKFRDNFDAKKFKGRNDGNRKIARSEFEGIVLNRIEILDIKDNYVEISKLKHDNLEPIFNFQTTDDFVFFTTPLFSCKLATVWEEKSHTKQDIKEMFYDFWKALNFLKSQNISHGTIHENNLAFDGKKWYVSGLLSTEKIGSCMSGLVNSYSYKSRRSSLINLNYNDEKFHTIPSDDMWQLVLMYVITYYGLNPFNDLDHCVNTTNYYYCHSLIDNIRNGKCKEISKSLNGKYLEEILTSKNELENDDYDKILKIFQNNTD